MQLSVAWLKVDFVLFFQPSHLSLLSRFLLAAHLISSPLQSILSSSTHSSLRHLVRTQTAAAAAGCEKEECKMHQVGFFSPGCCSLCTQDDGLSLRWVIASPAKEVFKVPPLQLLSNLFRPAMASIGWKLKWPNSYPNGFKKSSRREMMLRRQHDESLQQQAYKQHLVKFRLLS